MKSVFRQRSPKEAGDRISKSESGDTRATDINFQKKQEIEDAKGNQETQEQMKSVPKEVGD
jgi:hypothetical protein